MRTTARPRIRTNRWRRVRTVVNFPRCRTFTALAALSLFIEVAVAHGLEESSPSRSIESAAANRVTSEVLWTPRDAWSDGWSPDSLERVWAEREGRWSAARPVNEPGDAALHVGITRAFATHWRASYGMLFADD